MDDATPLQTALDSSELTSVVFLTPTSLLPTEIWKIILGFLPFYRDRVDHRMTCSRTCRLFRTILLPSLFQTIKINIEENHVFKRDYTVLSRLSHLVTTLHLSIHPVKFSTVQDMQRFFMHFLHVLTLEKVKWLHIENRLCSRLISQFPGFLRGLERIYVCCEDGPSSALLADLINRSADTLASFTLHHVPVVKEPVIASLNSCKRLENLDLGFAYCDESEDSTLMGLPVVGQSVRYLSMMMAMGESDTVGINGLHNFISLTSISFCDVTFRDPLRRDQLDSCLRSCKQTLTKVDFLKCYWEVPPQGLLECRQLKEVAFFGCQNHMWRGLSGSDSFRTKFWTTLISSSPFLTDLTISNFPCVDYMLLKEICSTRPNSLKRLTLEPVSCRRVLENTVVNSLKQVTDDWWGVKNIPSGPSSNLKELRLLHFPDLSDLSNKDALLANQDLQPIASLFQSHGIQLSLSRFEFCSISPFSDSF